MLKKLIEKLPMQIKLFGSVALFWIPAIVLSTYEATPGTIDSYLDYVLIALYLIPLVYWLVRMLSLSK